MRDSMIKLMLVETASHPYAVVRARELRRWVDSGEYTRILAGAYPRRDEDAAADLSEAARDAARSYTEAFQRTQDALGRFLHETLGVVGAVKGWVDANFRRGGDN